MQLNQSLRVCPLCHKDDRIEKVSAVHSREVHIGFVEGTTTNIVGSSALGQRLAPPTQPTYKSPWGGCSIAFVIFFSFVALVGLLANFSAPLSGVFMLLVVGLVIIYKVIESSRRRAQVNVQVPAYKVAYDRWNRLYYCHRDGTVFE